MAFNAPTEPPYFIACLIEPDNKTAQYVVGDRDSGTVWASEVLSFTGELNRSCTADLILGMHADSYWYAGGLDDWFLDCDTNLTADDLVDYFRCSVMANGGDTSGDVDGITEPGAVTLRASNGVYPSEGVLTTAAADCNLSGTGRVSVTSEYISGTTAVSLVETSTSDDLEEWSDWAAVPSDGKLASPNRAYIRFRVTLTTTDTSRTPKVIDIRLYDIPKAPYEKIGYARPVVLDSNGAWEAVLENAYDIIVTSEINGEDTLSFKIPYRDGKRGYYDMAFPTRSEVKEDIINSVIKNYVDNSSSPLADKSPVDMKITVRLHKTTAYGDNVPASGEIRLSDSFVISGIKITCHDGTIDYEMPKIKSKDGNYYDMAVPLNDRFGQLLKEKVLSEYGLLSTQILCGNINHAELTAEGEVAYKLFKNNSIAQKVINQLSERNIKYSAKINARETTICFLKSDFETMREISLKAASETENHKKL